MNSDEIGRNKKKGGFIYLFWKEKTPHLGASVVVLSPHPSAAPDGSGGLGEGSGSGCRTGEDADLGGCAPPSLALADLEMGVPIGIPTASEAEERPLCCGGEEEEDLSETSSSMPRSPSWTSTLPTSTWRSFRWRVSLGGGARRSPRLPARPLGPGWTREVDARAGDDGVEADEEDGVTDERWNADLERFHHDGIVTAAGGEWGRR